MTEATETKKTTRKANPLTGIMTEIRNKAEEAEPIPFVGGYNGEGGQAFHAQQEHRWSTVNQYRNRQGKLGYDGLILEDAHAAGAATTDHDRREALVLLAAQAVAAIAQLDRGEG
ncbi:hypothetical protein [Streptomyces phage phiScoe3]|nr:hypothetical protein [Streptomyces phage phiScoe3]